MSHPSAPERPTADELFPQIYDELRRVARRQLRHERTGHTLDSVALVNEVWLRLAPPPADGERRGFVDRAHFVAVCARAMRGILVDHARARRTAKRGSGGPAFPLDESADALAAIVPEARVDEVLAIDDALERLALVNAEAARVVECRVFGGLGNEETADALGLSVATARRRWAFGRAWLARALGVQESGLLGPPPEP